MMLTPFRSHRARPRSNWLIDGWEPFGELGSWDSESSRLSFDVTEKDDKYEIVAHVPVPRDKVKLSVKDGVVTISGSDSSSSTREVDGYTCTSSSSSSFSRSFPLPAGISPEAVTATRAADNSVKIVIPKPEPGQHDELEDVTPMPIEIEQ